MAAPYNKVQPPMPTVPWNGGPGQTGGTDKIQKVDPVANGQPIDSMPDMSKGPKRAYRGD